MTSDYWILCVDDDEKLLSGLELQLGLDHDVMTATSGAAGLALLDERPNCAVVVSDMRMPHMNGAEFLAKARLLVPETTRMLLTGLSDVNDTVSAVNEGAIFRFLTKPTPPDFMNVAVEAGIRQWQLVRSERVLLEETLHGAALTLIEALEIASPDAFARSRRMEAGCRHVAVQVGAEPVWEVALAGLLLRVGWISLPDSVVIDLLRGPATDPDQLSMLDDALKMTVRLIDRIPRLNGVASIIEQASARDADPGDLPLAVSIVRAVREYDDDLRFGTKPAKALAALSAGHAPEIIEALRSWPQIDTESSTREVALGQLVEGMLTARDIVTPSGNLLVKSGTEIGAALVERLRNFSRTHGVVEPILVAVA